MSARIPKLRFILVVVSILGMFLILESASNHPIKPAILAKPFPVPNGYDDLIVAGKMVGDDSPVVTNLDLGQLRDLVTHDADAIKRTRLGLSRECRVPMDFHPESPDRVNNLMAMKALATVLQAEGRLAEMENRVDDAARSYVDIFNLGQSSARGGILIDELVGIAVEHRAVICLTNLEERLDAKSCRETAAALEALDAQRQPWQEVLSQERYWSLMAFPGIKYRLAELFTAGSIKKSRQQTEKRFNDQVTRTRAVMASLAARAYQLEKGRSPATLDELVPDYLKAVPLDPVTGKPIAYNP